MAKYRKKPIIVDNIEQYFHNKPCKGVNVRFPEIIYSLDGKLFYITNLDRATDWLSIEKGEDGKYVSYPFAFYSIKSGKREPIENNPSLVELYTKCFELKQPKPYAWVETIHKGQTVTVQEGDYIIPEPDGIHFYPCKPDIFENTYEKVD